jgi:hypothetical protein
LPKGEIKKICFSKGGEELGVFSTVLSKEKREEKRGVVYAPNRGDDGRFRL